MSSITRVAVPTDDLSVHARYATPALLEAGELRPAPAAVRLLLIDGDTGLGEPLRSRGFEVEICADGPRGLAGALEGRGDVVVVTAVLPGTDTAQLVREIRRQSMVPIILLTPSPERAARIAGLDAGADDVLALPVLVDELVATMRAVLRRSHAPVPPRLPNLGAHGVRLDPMTRDVSVDGTAIELTSTEYEILECLVRRRGKVVPRDELVAVACHRAATPYDRALDVHVSHLRKKIGDRRRYLRTVRGVGYLFCAE